eukprot:TRINITY_DN2122_c0_g1_i1.p1 TRINITY_DN2122_c0_g1~~TRINITY_DN2122_c0_g1_i1.p1  ORF type:complete len:331 (+),score=34.90 TRINITY_DN2122_c0_g1_i1:20-1012(+)
MTLYGIVRRSVGKLIDIYSACLSFTLNLFFFGRFIDCFLATFQTLIRCGSGTCVAYRLQGAKRPTKPLILYEYEGCPFCRRVRECLSVLDLDVVIRPCPREAYTSVAPDQSSSRFRPQAVAAGGKMLFPLLIDENAPAGQKPVVMYHSDAIIQYLWSEYGRAAIPPVGYALATLVRPVDRLTSFVGTLARPLPRMGLMRTPSLAPKQPLVLWNFEGSPFCRLVREALASLEIEHTVINVAHGAAAKRAAFHRQHADMLSSGRLKLGAVIVPLLEDPNGNPSVIPRYTTAKRLRGGGVALAESADIVRYLYATYATGPTLCGSLGRYVGGA